jgi:tRNA(Ile2) C34 agmatinyltransferase TiaS
LAEHGVERSISGVESMLRSRVYLGEIHFGELHNLTAHEPIIKDRAVFERVQRRTVSRGRQAKSERLLARLGVLRCGTCGSRMVINGYTGSYRCGDSSANRCRRRAAVKADRSRRWCWTRSGRTRPPPTGMDARRASGRSASGRGDRTRRRGSR